MAGLLPLANRLKNGIVNKKGAEIVNGFNGWIGSNDYTNIADVVSSYFAAIVVVSQYNTRAAMYMVSVGSNSTGLKVEEITSVDRSISFGYSNSKLQIKNAMDCNVAVMVLCNYE